MTGVTIVPGPRQQGVDAQRLGDQIRQDVQRAVQEAQQAAAQARMEAAEARGEAVRAAMEAQGVPLERGATFRVDEDGNIVPLDPSDAPTAVVVQPPDFPLPPGPPQEAVTIAIAFFIMLAVIIVGLPLARAFARRMDRHGEAAPKLAAEQSERVARIEQAVDAISIEVERISEGQRFVTKLLTERALPEGQGADGAGARRADPLPVGGERR